MIQKITLTLLIGLNCCYWGFSQTFTAGETYWDSTGFVEYRAGNLPIIISAPHGGDWAPDSIPDRDCSGCSYLMDSHTRIITYGLYEGIHQITGCFPNMVMNRLHRRKFDANRDIEDAADGNPLIEQAWKGYHAFIDSAKARITEEYGRGLFLDIHGHAHTIQRTELGYLLSSQELDDPEPNINSSSYVEASSIRTLVSDNIQGLTHVELLRGESSFGALMENKGFPSVPSTSDPFPDNGEPYFSGGYNTVRHGSRDNNGFIDAIQIELNQDVRFDQVTRAILIDSLAQIIVNYIDLHYHDSFIDNYCHSLSTVLQLESQDFDFSIFPNPASNYFTVAHNQNELDIKLYNSLGQIVASGNTSQNRIDVKFLPNGIYIVLLKSSNKILGAIRLLKHE